MTDEHYFLQGVRTEYTKYEYMCFDKIIRKFQEKLLKYKKTVKVSDYDVRKINN